MNIPDEEDWDLEITRANNILDLKLNDVWRYRDLLWLLVRRDFVAFYKQTVLGPLWFVLQPIFTTFIFTIIFGYLAKISPSSKNSIPTPLFFLAGTVLWSYFADSVTKTS